MPRSAATILAFLLVAGSIGFNTVRYPVVWEMVGPARAGESVQPAVASQPEKAEPPPQQPALPPSPAAKPIEVEPAAEMTGKIMEDHTVSGEAKSARDDDAAAADSQTQKPLVPVAAVNSAGTPRNEVVGGAGIRRLPPVTQADPIAASRDTAPASSGSIPVYPSTGIE